MDAEQRLKRLDHLNTLLEAAFHSMQALGGGEPCELVDEKVFKGNSTPEGNLCRKRKRTLYLIHVLQCEAEPIPSPTCCDDAADEYCVGWEACPD